MEDLAPQQKFKRTVLQRSDVPASSYELVTAVSELPADGYIPREIHPGVETGYVLDGSATLFVEGQPALSLAPGQSWKLAPEAEHEFRAGPNGVKVLASWAVEKGRPFSSPTK